ncbi:glycosyltransferase family 2 protein [Caldivirga sp. UBA161]|uniref:glycosyltransferase family 2 protein n=1 Tax=Caldivirga sp. UBA161 TaxID=1915569 RepID=UPI0025C2B34B|nr:glycosyltransferase family 2 protein [Caldivirga sp. UBA161]
MINPTVAVIIAVTVLMIYPILILIYDIHNYLAYRRGRRSSTMECLNGFGTLSVIIPTWHEPMSTVIDAIKRALSFNWPGPIEVIVVSDDEEDYVNDLKHRVNGLGDNVKVLRRVNKNAGKAGALDYGFRHSRGDYVLTMDVDSLIDPNFPLKACGLMTNDNVVAVAGRWFGYNTDTLVSEAVTASMNLAVDTIQGGRRARGLPALVVGTGTMFKASALREVDGWSGSGPQDDIYVWLKLISMGFDIDFIDGKVVGVENPRTYSVFRFQQSKWAYGVADALRRMIRRLMSSGVSTRVKLDAVLLLTQYVTPALLILSSLIIGVTSLLLGGFIGLATLPLLILYGSLALVYGYIPLRTRSGGLTPYSAGRSSAMVMAMSMQVLYSYIKGALGSSFRGWDVTPKGGMTVIKALPIETIMMITFTVLLILNLIHGYLSSSLWVAVGDAPYAYVHYRFAREIL